MPLPDDDPIPRLLGELLRAPPPVRELPLEQALTRLQAARGDAAYLLLHRVLVLETALQQLRAGAAAPSSAPGAAPAGGPRPVPQATALPRTVLRDAAAVALGVVAGQAVWQALDGDTAAAATGAAADVAGEAGSWLGL
jgi:hypothetical protein